MLIEGYIALLSLPTDHRATEAMAKLRGFEKGFDGTERDSHLISRSFEVAESLAEERGDSDRVVRLLRGFYGSSAAGIGIRDYDFRQLVEANDLNGIREFLESDADNIRIHRIETLCSDSKFSLAREAAASWADPKNDGIAAHFLAELGAVAEVEERARRHMNPTSRYPNGREMLTKLGMAESRRGNTDYVQRLVQRLIDDPEALRLAQSDSSAAVGRCEWKPRNDDWNWHSRSIGWHAASWPTFDRWSQGKNKILAVNLGDALAGVGANARSVDLIDQLIALVDREIARKGFDPLNMTLLSNSISDQKAFEYREAGSALDAAKQSLRLARVAAGGDIDDLTAKSLHLDAVMEFLGRYPHSDLSRRILAFSTSEQERIRRVQPDLDASLQFVARVHQGQGAAALALANADPAVTKLGGWRLLNLVVMLENFGMRPQSIAALNAYVNVYSEADDGAVSLFLVQGQNDRAKIMLRNFISSGRDVFLGVMLLRELGEKVDVSKLGASTPSKDDDEKALQDWVAAIDALAWHAASDEIDAAIRNPPSAVLSLPERDADCVRDTVRGLQAIALARRGDLESALELVTGRTIEQRDFRLGQGKLHSQIPFFDLRFLVQEWAARGHAVN